MIFFVSLHKNSLQKSKMTEINQYRQELKDRIISYAMPEFYKRGVKAVKMDEISQGLHVSRALKKVPNFKLHSLFLNFNSCPRSISSFKSGILFWTGI